ncbi:MAG: phosphatidate cytidylyltransferase [Prevotellaceae bacterium]|jgi:phosphatidate cytidylyltransferase|nr:phosphatidate cytidylyltransferase [Prevotellaceae bacterium]
MKNLRIRTISGIVFVGIMVGCLLGGKVPYACLMLFLLISMLIEFYTLTLGPKQWPQKTIGILAGACLWMATFLLMDNAEPLLILSLLCAMFLLWMALLIQQLYKKHDKPFETVAYTLLGYIYIALPLTLMNLPAFIGRSTTEYDGRLLLGLFIILWSSDVGAYAFGSLFGQHGRHRLFPSISPKKTWEGFVGGLLIAALTAYILRLTGFFTCGLGHLWAIAALLTVFGMFGDLIESMLKRSAGVKDSGKLMPGHGGMLDRFDGALLAFPAACLYIFVIDICLI